MFIVGYQRVFERDKVTLTGWVIPYRSSPIKK